MPNAREDPRELYEHRKRNAAVLSALSAALALCQRVKERQHTARQLHTRLHQAFLRCTAPDLAADDRHRAWLEPRHATRFTALVAAFQLALQRHARLHASVVRRVLHHRMFSLHLRSVHHQLSAFLREAGGETTQLMDWRTAFESALRQDESVLHSTLSTVVQSSSWLQREYLNLSTRQQMEVLLDVRHELGQRVDRSPVLDDCLRTIYRRLVRLFGWDLSERSRRPPRWFLPLGAVDYSASKDLLSRDRATFRGEIAVEERGGYMRHLVALKCFGGATTQLDRPVDEVLRAMTAFMDQCCGPDVEHAHVARVRGANYVSGSPFVVRDFAVHGTLSAYLRRRTRHGQAMHSDLETMALLWRMLADACEGLRFLHEHKGVAHAGLKASNLLVNHHGHVVVADFGVRDLRRQLHVRDYNDADYVRWLAPELIHKHPRVGECDSVALTRGVAGDIYALGMCIVEILSEESPWAGVDACHVEDTKQSRGTLPPRPTSVPPRAWDLVQKMCASDASARLPLREVRERLLALSRDDATVSTCHSEPSVPPTVAAIAPAHIVENADAFETESVAAYESTHEQMESTEVEHHTVTEDSHDEWATDREDSGDSFDLYDDDDHKVKPRPFQLAIHTNGQLNDAIDCIAECTSPDAQTLLPHLQLLCTFAREEAQSIHDRGGVRVLNVLLHLDPPDDEIRTATLEIYRSMVESAHVSVAETLVEEGLITVILETLANAESDGEQVETCVSLLLNLMAQTDVAKRELGSSVTANVAVIEQNEHVHHRSLLEIKSVLARFKQMEGNELMKEGFHALAVLKFTEAIQLDRKRGMYYADRSLAFCHGGLFLEAIEDAQRCMRYNPFDVQGYLRYGTAMKHMRKFNEALAALRKGREVNPNCEKIAMMMREVQELRDQQRTH